MAKYEIKHSCGHVQTTQLYGTNVRREREHQAARLAQQPCPDCRRITTETTVAVEPATVEVGADGLPVLTAHHPQLIRIGQRDRAVALEQLTEQLTAAAAGQPAELVDELVALYREVLLRHTDAAWWAEVQGRHLGRVAQREMTAEDRTRLAALAARG